MRGGYDSRNVPRGVLSRFVASSTMDGSALNPAASANTFRAYLNAKDRKHTCDASTPAALIAQTPICQERAAEYGTRRDPPTKYAPPKTVCVSARSMMIRKNLSATRWGHALLLLSAHAISKTVIAVAFTPCLNHH